MPSYAVNNLLPQTQWLIAAYMYPQRVKRKASLETSHIWKLKEIIIIYNEWE